MEKMKAKMDDKAKKLKELEAWRKKLNSGKDQKGASCPEGLPKTLP